MKDNQTRLLGLMNRLSWRGVGDWTKETESRQQEAIPAFKDWLTSRLAFIEADARQSAQDFYFNNGISNSKTSRYNMWLDRARVALVALYRYEVESGKEWSALLNEVHDIAMDLCDDADVLMHKGQPQVPLLDATEGLFLNAVELEKLVAEYTNVEPSRTVLVFSAANMATKLKRETALETLDQLIPMLSDATTIHTLVGLRKEISGEES